MKNSTTTEFVLASLFAAIIIIMAFTPLGFIPLGIINATIIQVPVIVGSLFCGPKKGAFLGFLFGFTSFLKSTITPTSLSAFVFSPVLAANLYGIRGVLCSTFICFVPRIMVGVLPYYIYKGLKKVTPWKPVPFAVAGIVGSFVNTLLVMGSIYVLYKDSYALAQGVDPTAILGVIGGIIGVVGVIESLVSGVLVTSLGMVLKNIKEIQ